jgi:membrane fusion protein (multidrug efflux system)
MKFATLFIAAAFAVAACSQDTGDAASTPTSDMAMDAQSRLPGTAVEARTVTAGTLIGRIESSGLIRGIGEAWVVAETQGDIESVLVSLGDEVSEGAPLVTFDRELQELQLRQAETQLESARLDLAATERLYNSGNASMAELARARSAAAGAEAAVETARRALANRTIEAPIAGRVADKADGSRVARIIDTSRLQLEIALGEREIRYVRRGGAAVVTVPACGEAPFDATVVAIAAASDPSTGAFPVVVEWPNECGETVRAGMSATVDILPATEPAILVPSTAVLSGENGPYVYVAEDGVAHRLPIALGNRSGNAVEVIDGLEEGAVIITSGLSRLTDESRVAVTVIGETGAL